MHQVLPELLAWPEWQAAGAPDLALVYVSEAHAEDEWPNGQAHMTAPPSGGPLLASADLGERAVRLRRLAAKYGVVAQPRSAPGGGPPTALAPGAAAGAKPAPLAPAVARLLVDTMDGAFEKALGGWPIGIYLLGGNGALLLQVLPRHGLFDLAPLRRALASASTQSAGRAGPAAPQSTQSTQSP